VVGSKSLLRHTLDRVELQIAPERTVIVTCRAHDTYMIEEFAETPPHGVLVQPQDCGTAAGIFFPAHWIHSQDREAIVAVFPSDHFILERKAFMAHVARVAAFVQRDPTRLVLLGAKPDTHETQYGWIEPGEPVGRVGPETLHQVKRFWEKPSQDRARACLAGGCRWNAFVFVVKVSTLIDAGRELLPELTQRMASATRLRAAGHILAGDQQFALAPNADFSRTILEACPSLLAVCQLPAITWSDLGTPRMVMQTLQVMAAKGH
jgi:mannose-1-phosphate guanylyltransferase